MNVLNIILKSEHSTLHHQNPNQNSQQHIIELTHKYIPTHIITIISPGRYLSFLGNLTLDSSLVLNTGRVALYLSGGHLISQYPRVPMD